MKLSAQVCSLEQAKKLKELGIEQSGICMYYESSIGVVLLHKVQPETLVNEWCAFTVAELGVMLPCGFSSGNGVYDHSVKWIECANKGRLCGGIDKNVFATEAEARAAMLIYLLETKLVTAADCNKRLTCP